MFSDIKVYEVFVYLGWHEAPMLWSPFMKNQIIGKDPDAGIDWRQKEKGIAEDEMVT